METVQKTTELQRALSNAVEMIPLDISSLERLAQNGHIVGTVHSSHGGGAMNHGVLILYRDNGEYRLGRVGGQLAQFAEENFLDISKDFSEMSPLYHMSRYYISNDSRGG